MKNFTIEIKWAIIFTIISVFWILLEKLVGLHDIYINKHIFYTNLFAFPAILIYVLALKEKKNNFFKIKMNWSQGFVTGIFISFIIALLNPIAQYISMTFVSPHFFENAINNAVTMKMMTLSAATDYFNLKSYIIQGALGGLSMGVVTAAIVAYFLQTKNLKK